MVEVAGFRHAHRRVDEQVGPSLFRRTQRELVVRPMHRVAGLEGHDPLPSQLAELGPELRRRQPQVAEVVVGRHGHAFDPAPRVEGMRPVEQRGDAGMLAVGRSVDGLSLGHAVRLPDLLHVKGGQHHALGVAEGHDRAWPQLRGRRLREVQDHGDGPQVTGDEAHGGAHGFVIAAAHEASKG